MSKKRVNPRQPPPLVSGTRDIEWNKEYHLEIILKKCLSASKIWNRRFFLSMVEYSTCARQEMRARQTFFQNDILWLILHILRIFKILISFKFIAVNAFEYCGFHEKSKKKLKFFKIFKFSKFLEKIEFSKKNFNLQIALKNSLFELWPNKKNCNEILS